MEGKKTRINTYVYKVEDRHGKFFYDRFKLKIINCFMYSNNVFKYQCINDAKEIGKAIIGLSNYIVPGTPHVNIDMLIKTIEDYIGF